jgi:hypothetical protein
MLRAIASTEAAAESPAEALSRALLQLRYLPDAAARAMLEDPPGQHVARRVRALNVLTADIEASWIGDAEGEQLLERATRLVSLLSSRQGEATSFPHGSPFHLLGGDLILQIATQIADGDCLCLTLTCRYFRDVVLERFATVPNGCSGRVAPRLRSSACDKLADAADTIGRNQ